MGRLQRFSSPRHLFFLILLAALTLRLIFFVGITGTRDELTEMNNSLNAWHFFPSLTWPSFNRLALALPKQLVFRLLGETEIASSSITFLTSLGCVGLAFGLGSRLFGPAEGLWASALMAVSSLDLIYSGAAYATDIPFAFYVGLAAWASLCYLKGGGIGRLLAAGFCIWLAFRAKELGAWITLPLLYLGAPDRRRALQLAAAAGAFLFADALFCHVKTGVWFPDRVAIYALFGDKLGAIGPFSLETVLHEKGRLLFQSDVLGAFPYAAVLGLLAAPWTLRKRAYRFVLLWFFGFLAALILKPAGWSRTEGLLTFWWDFPRYYEILLLPCALLLAAAAGAFPDRWRSWWLPLGVLAVVSSVSLALSSRRARIGRSHQQWMRWTVQDIGRLPEGSPVVVDQGLGIWIRFKAHSLQRRYRLTEVDAENPSVRQRMETVFKPGRKAYLVTGGPRGLETPDHWRLLRSAASTWPGEVSLVLQRPPGTMEFDHYYLLRDPLEIWAITRR